MSPNRAADPLVESFNFALGLGVAGSAVLLVYVVGLEEFFEAVASSFSSGEPGGEY